MKQKSRSQLIQTLLKTIQDDYVFTVGDLVIYVPEAMSTSLFMAGRLGTVISVLHKGDNDIQFYGVRWTNFELSDKVEGNDIPWSAITATSLRKFSNHIPEHYGLNSYYNYAQEQELQEEEKKNDISEENRIIQDAKNNQRLIILPPDHGDLALIQECIDYTDKVLKGVIKYDTA